ncbi:glycosyl hydrolase 115 family protein [Bifidobacterium sp. ESL0798]|uniref:glycosyl hydrolase 115 family protein n=1 Tax=Bifidobacterium sp. ESL0798 TaxID=2983235 RepID=UPI0023F61CF9|nr:glycosyl hydrolase 115 family protein [Bifidobacterium sp. ESL0798]WEV73845.1 glycosyl hydrolase 115 family protein [Bifidobacterium sp. ESL0798]
MSSFITSQTRVVGDKPSKAVSFAVEDVLRDIGKVLLPAGGKGADIVLVTGPHDSEAYEIDTTGGNVEIHAGDDFGFIFGLYAFSRQILGVKDFWFWDDQRFEPRQRIEVADDLRIVSKPAAVTYRGFFVNDEVLLENWQVDNDKAKPGRLAFETIYRLGGNLVIPGSGQRGEPHLKLARDMGFYINQHHVTPLGAPMFATAYPGVKPLWPEQKDRFQALWQKAIDEQKNQRTIWTLGFRGQGDQPFWNVDARYDTDEARGKVLSEVIDLQYKMVQRAYPGAPCCIYLYGEMMDLYRKGLLKYPEALIKIWSDNGFGRMVSRRQENWNPRVPAMPEGDGGNGIYYHASFYDLQAANHITQLCCDPRLIQRELEAVIRNGGDDVWIINSSNIKPHVYMLNMIAALWREGTIDFEQTAKSYIADYYGERNVEAVFALFEQYWNIAVHYGPNWDDCAGEQYFNHVPRMLITQYLRNRTQPSLDLKWMCDGPDLNTQIIHYRDQVAPAVKRYRDFLLQVESVAAQIELNGDAAEAELVRDSIGLMANIYSHCVAGACYVCQSLLQADQGHWRHAFYYAGVAREEFAAGNAAMQAREHGKWAGFWDNDCLADVSQSAYICGKLMSYARVMGDGPHFYQWKRDFMYPEGEKTVFVIATMEKYKTDDEIFAAMKAAWQR